MAKPIKKALLIHLAELKNLSEDKWGNPTVINVAELKFIRIEPSSKMITDKENKQIQLTALLFYDCYHSRPKDVEFKQGQEIHTLDNIYEIQTIDPIYDNKKIHHYEIGLV